MYSLLLVIIYVAFISLGLPDSLLGAGWPVMHQELNVSTSYAGIITIVISLGTIFSSIMSDRLTKKLGTGLVTAVSVSMTAVAMFGFSFSNSFIFLVLWAIPYGLGAGAVDAALNNYVAINYASAHMNWLHCFWGIGASVSPYIMSYALGGGHGWQGGYKFVGILQVIITLILFLSLPLWTKNDINQNNDSKHLSIKEVIDIKGVKYILVIFFGYNALESTTGLWASSYLVEFRGVEVELAARFASLFFIGITVGRFISGLISEKMGDKRLIKYGLLTATAGIILIMIPISNNLFALIGIIVIGFGCAPVYPSIIHAIPVHYGPEKSQAIIGVQMASAFVGSIIMPPFFGWLAGITTIGLYPFYLLLIVSVMIVVASKLNKIVRM